MKSVLLSLRPEWCEKIVRGQKTIEVRKSAPKEAPFKAFIYCVKGKSPDVLLKDNNNRFSFGDYRNDGYGFDIANGKVIGEFICDSVTKYPYELIADGAHFMPYGDLEKTCLDGWELYDYLREKDGYGWHISDLKIYDKPRELSEFISANERCKVGYSICNRIVCGVYPCPLMAITRPPQSWQYVEEVEE